MCSAASVYLSTLDPAMEVLKICEGWFVCACWMLLCTKGPVKSPKARAFSLLQTVICIFPSLLEHLCDVGTHRHPPISQFSTVPYPLLCFQTEAGAYMLYSFSVSLGNKATKQIQLNAEIKVQWKNRHLCSVSYFWSFSPIFLHKQPPPPLLFTVSSII